jgi:hypothetical protein
MSTPGCPHLTLRECCATTSAWMESSRLLTTRLPMTPLDAFRPFAWYLPAPGWCPLGSLVHLPGPGPGF